MFDRIQGFVEIIVIYILMYWFHINGEGKVQMIYFGREYCTAKLHVVILDLIYAYDIFILELWTDYFDYLLNAVKGMSNVFLGE